MTLGQLFRVAVREMRQGKLEELRQQVEKTRQIRQARPFWNKVCRLITILYPQLGRHMAKSGVLEATAAFLEQVEPQYVAFQASQQQ